MPRPIPLLALLVPLWSQLGAQAPCFETALGTNLQLADQQVSPAQPLGFAFPFAGSTATSVWVSDNGFVWLQNSTDPACCHGTVGPFLQGLPRIAPLWMDLDPMAPGAGVFFNALPGRAVITWSAVPEAGSAGPAMTVQLQLESTGNLVFWFDGNVQNVRHDALTGITGGNGASNPGPLDFTRGLPFPSGSSSNPTTIHESFPTGRLDLQSRSVEFVPAGLGYLVIDRPGCRAAAFRPYGEGCPHPPSVYELFGGVPPDVGNQGLLFQPNGRGGWIVTACASCFDPTFAGGTNLALGDDSVATGLPLGFSWPHGGLTTTAVDVSANGCVYLQPGTIGHARCCDGDVELLLTETASIAVLWLDLDPGTTGAVWAHQPSPTTFTVTWDRVPETGTGIRNTAQVQLNAGGSFVLAYGPVGAQQHDTLIGYSPGNGVADPGPRDLTALPFDTGTAGAPVTLLAPPGSRPSLGTVLFLDVGSIPPTAPLGFLVFGNARFGGLELSPIGMPRCFQYQSVDAVTSFLVTGPTTRISLPVPANPGLIGFRLFTQAVLFAPLSNALGAVASNGGELVLGM